MVLPPWGSGMGTSHPRTLQSVPGGTGDSGQGCLWLTPFSALPESRMCPHRGTNSPPHPVTKRGRDVTDPHQPQAEPLLAPRPHVPLQTAPLLPPCPSHRRPLPVSTPARGQSPTHRGSRYLGEVTPGEGQQQ